MLSHTTIDSFAAVTVDTGPLALTLIPALGGKVSSLRDKRSGREWLWRHPRMPFRQVAHGGSYLTQADTGGWDECFPSVAPCAYPSAPWQGAPIQDHGELWSQVAELAIAETRGPGDEATVEQISLATTWHGIELPYVFQRAITLRSGSAALRCAYTVRNLSDSAMPFVWCIHPLLAIEPGMELRLPAGARFNCGASQPPGLLAQQRDIASSQLPIADLQPSAVALKVWSDPLGAGEGYSSLHAADGSLHMRWDPASLPQVAVWMNLAAWAGDGGAPYFNLGLEPCIGAQDSLADAVNEHNLYASVPPGGERHWWLELELFG